LQGGCGGYGGGDCGFSFGGGNGFNVVVVVIG